MWNENFVPYNQTFIVNLSIFICGLMKCDIFWLQDTSELRLENTNIKSELDAVNKKLKEQMATVLNTKGSMIVYANHSFTLFVETNKLLKAF